MAQTSTRRIQKELSDLTANPPANVKVRPNEADIMNWAVEVKGPSNSPYKGGTFKMTVIFTADYPFKPPTFKYLTKVHHPNIDPDGNICLEILKTEHWKPSTKISQVLTALYDLLETPNPDAPLVASIADQFRQDRAGFDKEAKEKTAKFAKP